MAAIAEAIRDFPKTVKAHSSKEHLPISKIVADIATVKSKNPAVYDERSLKGFLEKRTKVLHALLEQCFVAKIAKHFPLIDDSLFELKRHILLKKNASGAFVVSQDQTTPVSIPVETPVEGSSNRRRRGAVGPNRVAKRDYKIVEIPLFAYTPLFAGNHECILGTYTKSERHYYSHRTTKVQISAKLPGAIGPNLRKAYREAMAKCHAALAECYADKIVGDLMTENTPVEVGAIWIPTPTSLSVKTEIKVRIERPDPAMVLKIRGKTFLVKMWSVDDEESLEHYIREFTTDSLEGVL